MSGFALDPRLAANATPLRRLGPCRVLLKDDARFVWLLLVPEVAGAAQAFDLAPETRAGLFEAIVAAERAVAGVPNVAKVNVAWLGNVVRQLHVHVVGRFTDDPAWPGAVWHHGEGPGRGEEARDRLVARLGF